MSTWSREGARGFRDKREALLKSYPGLTARRDPTLLQSYSLRKRSYPKALVSTCSALRGPGARGSLKAGPPDPSYATLSLEVRRGLKTSSQQKSKPS